MSECSQNKPSHLAPRCECIEFPQWSRCHSAHGRCISMATKQPGQSVSRFHDQNCFLLTPDPPNDIKTNSKHQSHIERSRTMDSYSPATWKGGNQTGSLNQSNVGRTQIKITNVMVMWVFPDHPLPLEAVTSPNNLQLQKLNANIF